MKFFKNTCLLFGLVIAATTNGQPLVDSENVRNIYQSLEAGGHPEMVNEFVDMVITELKSVMVEKGFDPMKLQDFYKNISYKPIIITYWGDLNMTNGLLRDTSTMTRNGEAISNYEGKILKLEVPVSFKDFLFEYSYRLRIMGLGPKGGVEGRATNIRVTSHYEIDFEKAEVALKGFTSKVGSISVRFSGNILFDWMINIMSEAITTFFKSIVVTVVEGMMQEDLQNIIEDINKSLGELKPSVPINWK